MRDFDGDTIVPERDNTRLHPQLVAVLSKFLHEANQWLMLPFIIMDVQRMTGTNAGAAAITARIRDLRKAKFGGYHIESRYVTRGVWAYRMVI